MAFRVPAAEGEEALDYLFEREMMTGIYRASWRSAETREGLIPAMAFVVDRPPRQNAAALDHDSVVALILPGRGDRGPCVPYPEKTDHPLPPPGPQAVALTRPFTDKQRITGHK